MRCYSLVSHGYLVTSVGHYGLYGGGYHVPDSYPQPKPGFDLDPRDRVLKIGFAERIAASEELLTLPPDSGAIVRDGMQVKILRASVEVQNGRPVLVPEKPEDTDDALVFVDVGSGRHGFVRYSCAEDGQLVRDSLADNEPYRSQLLVRLKPFAEPVLAQRSSKKWVLWGPEQVKETLAIKFDGKNVFYDVRRPDAVGN